MISVAMATYNGEKYLKEQLDSILNQSTSQPLELIICDDLSTDSTRKILQEYAEKDSRIRLYFNDVNLGFSKNFKKAISLCTGDFIALSDQDDIWETDKLEKLVNNIGDYDFICSNSMLVNKDNESQNITMQDVANYHWIPKDTFELFKRILYSNIVQGSTMLAHSDFLKSCSATPAQIKYHDWWFAFNSCAKNGFIYLNECTIRYRRHENTETIANEKLSFIQEQGLTLKKEKYDFECAKNDERLERLLLLKNTIPFKKREYDFLNATIRYYTELKDKTLFTFIYFAKNCKYIYLDKNIIRNTFRILKRFFGLIAWKILLRRKIQG